MTNDRPMDCSTGKRWFRHEHDAKYRAIADEQEFGFRMKVYRCPECGWWHKARERYIGSPILLLDWIRKNRG